MQSSLCVRSDSSASNASLFRFCISESIASWYFPHLSHLSVIAVLISTVSVVYSCAVSVGSCFFRFASLGPRCPVVLFIRCVRFVVGLYSQVSLAIVCISCSRVWIWSCAVHSSHPAHVLISFVCIFIRLSLSFFWFSLLSCFHRKWVLHMHMIIWSRYFATDLLDQNVTSFGSG